MFAMIIARQTQMAVGKPKKPTLFRPDLIFLGEQHMNPGINQKRAEDVHDPGKLLDQFRAGKDHDAAHDQRPENSPFQHTVLKPLINRKGAKNDQEEEKVIDAQRLFDQIASKEFDGAFIPEEAPNSNSKQHRQRNPKKRRSKRLALLQIPIPNSTDNAIQRSVDRNASRSPTLCRRRLNAPRSSATDPSTKMLNPIQRRGVPMAARGAD